MKHFYKSLLPALLLPLFSLAQSSYKPGYVVTTKGDTLHGFINLKEWSGAPQNVEFKNSTGNKTYTANDIVFFEVLNFAYRKYIGSISTDETNLSRLSTGRDSSFKTDTAFLKLEQKGTNVTLYSYTDQIKTRYFIADNKSSTQYELIYRIYHVSDQGGATHSENVYVSQLFELAQKYNASSENLKRLIEKASYDLVDLKLISQKINNMTADNKRYSTPAALYFFAGVGVNLSFIKPTGTLPFLYNAPNNTSVRPTVSVGANLYSNPSVGRFVIRGEILFTEHAYKILADSYFNQPDKPKSEYQFSQYIISLYPQLLYNIYNTNALKFYLDAGIAVNFSKNTGNSFHNIATNTTTDNYLTLNTNWITYPIKAGFVLNKKFDISLAYAFSTSVTNNATSKAASNGNYSINVSSIRAGVSYIFSR
jgi:hypothetical protein